MKKSILFATIAATYIIQIALSTPPTPKQGGTQVAQKAACAPNEYRNGAGACTACGAGVAKCALVAGSKKILSCARGKFVDKTGACANCATGCDVCRSADQADCEKIQPGFQIITDLMSKRRKIVSCAGALNAGGTGIAHCNKCQIDKAAKANKCLECNPGKYLKVTPAVTNAQGVVTTAEVIECAACTQSNCAFCPGDVCKRCKDSHWEDMTSGTFACTSCAAGTMKCGSVTVGGKTTPRRCDVQKGCFECPPDFSLVSNPVGKYKNRMTCKNCADIDASCSMCTATKCLVCKDDKALKEDGTGCAKIGTDNVSASLTNCQAAQIKTIAGGAMVYSCNACNPGFFADAAGLCQALPQDCLFGKEANKCLMCKPGTFFDAAAAGGAKCVRCDVPGCRICNAKGKCNVCAPAKWFDSVSGTCKGCHHSCGECIDGSRAGCLTCRGDAVLITNQKAMGVTYEDAQKQADALDKPLSGSDLLKINLQMQQAMKAKPAQTRLLAAKEKISATEQADFDTLDKAGKVETDKKSTDLTDDKAMNEIWNSGGRLENVDGDAASRTKFEGKAKKVRKMVGICEKNCPENKAGMGFFYDKKTNVCFKCKSDCQKCGMFEGDCQTCGWGMYEVTDAAQTEAEDEDGNTIEVTTKKCEKCHASCKRCSGPAANQCKGCAKGFQLRNNTCVSGGRCKAGEVQLDSADTECVEDDGTRCKECKACNDKNCHRCKDNLAGGCYKCKKGYTRTSSGNCVKCSKGCLKCKDATTCLMCDKKYYLLENAKNSNSSAKVMCVERCPVFYTPVGFKSLPKSDKDRFQGDDGNYAADDAVNENKKKRDAYFKAKEDFKEGKATRADIEAAKAAVGTRLLAGFGFVVPSGGAKEEKKKDPLTGKELSTEDAGLKDLSDGQPLDSDVDKFVEFRGVCKPCQSNCGGGCAEGWAYREKKCVQSCNMTGEVTVTLDSFSVCRCPDGMFRDKKTQNCLACQAGCSKCQDAKKCDQCGSNQFLSINPLNKKRECVSQCAQGFTAVPWAKMSKSITDIYTKDRKAEAKKAEAKKMRLLAGNATANKSLDANGYYKPNATELAKEEKLKSRNPLDEVEVFKAVTFAGMCQPCLKGCTVCAEGFFLKGDGSCAKGCDSSSEETVIDPTTKKASCKKDNKPRLKIVWGSKKDEKDLMDDEKVNARKQARKDAVSSGDADGDAIDAAALGTDVDAEAEALNTGLQDPMEDLTLRAEWNQQMTGEFEWAWAVRAGIDNKDDFLRGVKTNGQTLVIPSSNLGEVDLKDITFAVKAKQGDARYETEFGLKMHKKPEIGFIMPDSIESGVRFDIQINFDGAKLDRADVYVLKVPAAGYQDPETGVVITEKDAKRQIEDVEEKNKNKIYAKKTEAEDRKQEKQAAGGADNELKRFRLTKNDFSNGKGWWTKGFAVKPSDKDFNVLLKLKACSTNGCFVRRKFLKVVKLSDGTRDVKAKESLNKMKSKDAFKTMDKDEIMDSLALLKTQQKSKKKACSTNCEIKDKSGKVVDKAEVEKENAWRKQKADAAKADFEKLKKEKEAKGETVVELVCPTSDNGSGVEEQCGGINFGVCSYGKKSGKARCACNKGFAGRACQLSEQEKDEMKVARKNAIEQMKEDAKSGKIQGHKQQKDFLKSVLADNDDEVDLDPEVADSLVESQKSYAAELRNKFKRKKSGKTDSSDADFEMPTKDELNEMMEQTMKLRKQRKAAKLQAEDEKEFTGNNTNATNKTDASGKQLLTAEERAAKKAEKQQARAAKKEEMAMMKDLQAVQSQSLADEMKASGKKNAIQEQSYGDTYMKTSVLDTSSIDDQMATSADGEKRMQIGTGSQAATKPDDAVAEEPAAPADTTATPAATTGANQAPATRRLADATPTNAGAPVSSDNSTKNATNDDWKKLPSEKDKMRVQINKKMFDKGMPFHGIKAFTVVFNAHEKDYVKEFPVAKKGSYHNNGTKMAKKEDNSTKPTNASEAFVDESDSELEDTAANQVFELEFINGDTGETVEVKNLTKGMLKICMMQKDANQRIAYLNEENEQLQEDGVEEDSLKQVSTKDETNQQEKKGYERCVNLGHATTFATIDGEASSSLFSYSMMVLMTLLAVLFFKQE